MLKAVVNLIHSSIEPVSVNRKKRREGKGKINTKFLCGYALCLRPKESGDF